MVTSDTRAVRLLPQADTLRIAGGLVDFLCAQTWAGTKEIALRHPELPARAIEFLLELIKAATQQSEFDTALLLGDCQQLLQRVLVQGPDKVELSQIPKLCCARWQVPDAKPPASSVIDVMLLARPLVDLETDYFSIPSAEALDTVIEQWSRILQHQGFLHMPLGWRLDALNSAGNSLLLRSYTSGRDSDIDVAEGFYQSAIAGSPTGWANLPKYHHNLGRALYLRYAERSGDSANLDRAIQGRRARHVRLSRC